MTALEDLRTAYAAANRKDRDGLFHRLSHERRHFGDVDRVDALYALWARLDWEEKKSFVEEFF